VNRLTGEDCELIVIDWKGLQDIEEKEDENDITYCELVEQKEVILESTTNVIDERWVNVSQESSIGMDIDEFDCLNERLCGLVDCFCGEVRCKKEYGIDSPMAIENEFSRGGSSTKHAWHAITKDNTEEHEWKDTEEVLAAHMRGQDMERMGVG